MNIDNMCMLIVVIGVFSILAAAVFLDTINTGYEDSL